MGKFTEAVYLAEKIDYKAVKHTMFSPHGMLRHRKLISDLTAVMNPVVEQVTYEEHKEDYYNVMSLQQDPDGRLVWHPHILWWCYCEKCKVLFVKEITNLRWIKDMRDNWDLRSWG